MEKFEISVPGMDGLLYFKVLNKETANSEYEVYIEDKLVAVFEPNEEEYILICRNPGGLDEEIIYLIADRIEAYHL